MARPLRLEVPDGIYHLTARGNERAAIFRDDTDRRQFLELVADLRESYYWRVLAYCLMGNHYHLLTQTPEPNLAQGMRQLNGVYAQSFNRRHDRVGHLLEGRYHARLVQADEHLLAAARYIVRNPIRAGFCRHPSEWRWSSHRATLGPILPGSWTSRRSSRTTRQRVRSHGGTTEHTSRKRTPSGHHTLWSTATRLSSPVRSHSCSPRRVSPTGTYVPR